MERRLLAILGAVAVAAVAVGLSAAATVSQGKSVEGESVQPAKKTQGVKPAMKTLARTPRRNANDPVATNSRPGQSAKEVESYWTKERMEEAQPMGKTRNSGSPSSPPAPSGTTTPGSAPTKKSTAQESSAKKPQSTRDTGVVTRSNGTADLSYWTDEAIDGAQPMEKTRPGAGSQDSPDPGGSTIDGSPPP